ncbi:MAG: tRNA 2-thiocytidine(32) synthetase TtcA [Pseudomonadales bacterium]|jgi:tRNA 2-thiocytidine biosynthesis protein TtcA|nr:tRNA 2-thiocytidine(32) synthetase TtcA [Pseudomonadota bacterium]
MATTPAYERAKLQKRLRRQVGQAIADYAMIEAGDRVMVCLSGGKDSYTLLDILRQLQATAPIEFELVAVNLDQKQPNFPEHVLPTYLEGLGLEYHIIEQDTYSVVKALTPEGKTYCPVCSRMRRGALYNFARRIGATKVALGHHLDDIVETLFLNLFHGATLKAMPPKLLSDDGDHILIRPLAYCREKDIARWAEAQAFPIIPCDLCGSQDGLERQVIKRMLAEWERAHPARIEKIAGALRRVVPSHLMDRELFDFAGLDGERAARSDSLRIPVKEG